LEIEIPYRLPQESYEDFKRKLGSVRKMVSEGSYAYFVTTYCSLA
jgi:hypothetical protein